MHLLRFYWLKLVRVGKRLARSSSSTHSIARGVAIGFIVGFEPIMGIQMAVAAAFAALFRANYLAAILPVWITNPVTFIPIYGFNYWFGHILTGLGPSMADYHAALEKARDTNAGAGAGYWENLWVSTIEGSKALASHGLDALWALLIGSTVIGVISALIAYPLTYRAISRLRQYRAAKKAAVR